MLQSYGEAISHRLARVHEGRINRSGSGAWLPSVQLPSGRSGTSQTMRPARRGDGLSIGEEALCAAAGATLSTHGGAAAMAADALTVGDQPGQGAPFAS